MLPLHEKTKLHFQLEQSNTGINECNSASSPEGCSELHVLEEWSSLYFFMCTLAVSARFMWRLHDDLCRSDFLPVFLYSQYPSWKTQPKLGCETNLMVTALTTCQNEETSFLTLDSMVDKFTCTILRDSEQSIPPSHLPNHTLFPHHGGWMIVKMLRFHAAPYQSTPVYL